MKTSFYCMVWTLVIGAGAMPAHAQIAYPTETISYQQAYAPSRAYTGASDTFIASASPSATSGDSQILEVDGDPERLALLRWSIPDVPVDAVVTRASITLDILDGSGDSFQLFAVSRDWTSDGATWEKTGLESWRNKGLTGLGDRGIIALGTLERPSSGLHTIDLNAAGLAVVQFWASQPERNFGVVLIPVVNATDGLDIASAESAAPERRPRIDVEYVTNKVTFLNAPPEARVAVERASGRAPFRVQFNASDSFDSDGTIVASEWDFGNGNTASGLIAQTTYATAGEHTAVLHLTDNQGGRSSVSVLVEATPPLVATYSASNGVNGYTGMEDTKIKDDAPTTAFGADPNMEVDGDPDYGTLMRWDLSDIPPGAIITDASLSLQITNLSGDAYPLYAMTRDWDEATATWEEAAAGIPWHAPGASGADDHATDILGEIRPTLSGRRTLIFTEAGVAAFQQWADDPSTNFGLIAQNYTTAADGVDFFSSDNADVSSRPILTVSYVEPEFLPPHTPPDLSIADNAPGTAQSVVTFTASSQTATHIAWTIDGTASTGPRTSHQFLAPGRYAITAAAYDDEQGLTVASTSVLISSAIYDPVALGVQLPSRLDILSVFPNPATIGARANIQWPANDVVVLELYDMLGRRLWSQQVATGAETIESTLLPSDGLARGVYVLRARSLTGNGVDTHLFTRQ